jgi:restriction endonuclease Mrr
MCASCDREVEQLTTVERCAIRSLSRELGQAMLRGIDAVGFRPTCAMDFAAIAAAARALAAALESTMGPTTIAVVKETADELAAEKLAAIGFSSAGSH